MREFLEETMLTHTLGMAKAPDGQWWCRCTAHSPSPRGLGLTPSEAARDFLSQLALPQEQWYFQPIGHVTGKLSLEELGLAGKPGQLKLSLQDLGL